MYPDALLILTPTVRLRNEVMAWAPRNICQSSLPLAPQPLSISFCVSFCFWGPCWLRHLSLPFDCFYHKCIHSKICASSWMTFRIIAKGLLIREHMAGPAFVRMSPYLFLNHPSQALCTPCMWNFLDTGPFLPYLQLDQISRITMRDTDKRIAYIL